MEKTTKKRVRNVVLGVTSAALVAGITSALTLAMLSDTHSKVNTFTADDALTAALYEPKWNNLDYDTGTQTEKDAGIPNDNLGETKAKKYSPNDAIPKDPYIVNTSDENEYVALRVTYQVQCDETDWHTISPEDFKQYFADYNVNSNWIKLNDTQLNATGATAKADYYLYATSDSSATALEPNTKTPSLFDAVTPDSGMSAYTAAVVGEDKYMFEVPSLSNEEHYESASLSDINGNEVKITVGNNAGLPKFRVIVIGAAIQELGYASNNVNTIADNLYDVFPDVIGFEKH